MQRQIEELKRIVRIMFGGLGRIAKLRRNRGLSMRSSILRFPLALNKEGRP